MLKIDLVGLSLTVLCVAPRHPLACAVLALSLDLIRAAVAYAVGRGTAAVAVGGFLAPRAPAVAELFAPAALLVLGIAGMGPGRLRRELRDLLEPWASLRRPWAGVAVRLAVASLMIWMGRSIGG